MRGKIKGPLFPANTLAQFRPDAAARSVKRFLRPKSSAREIFGLIFQRLVFTLCWPGSKMTQSFEKPAFFPNKSPINTPTTPRKLLPLRHTGFVRFPFSPLLLFFSFFTTRIFRRGKTTRLVFGSLLGCAISPSNARIWKTRRRFFSFKPLPSINELRN